MAAEYITRLVRYSWSIIIPIRYQIVRQCRIGKKYKRQFVWHVLKFRQSSFSIAHRIAVQSPRLSTRPSRSIGIPLVGVFMQDCAGQRIIVDNMIGTVVLTKMILHRSTGMVDCNLVESGITIRTESPESSSRFIILSMITGYCHLSLL